MMFRFLLLSPLCVLVSANIVGALIHYPILARWWTMLPTLGIVLDASASSSPDRLRRFSQASSAFRFLFPLFSNKSIPIKRRLQLHNQIVLAILLYGSESQTYTPAQLQRFNALHFKVLHHQKFVLSPGSCALSFLRLTSPYRRGAPRAHWYELALTEAYHRVHLVTMNQHPRPYEIHHAGYRTATLDLHKSYQGSHMPTFDNTKPFRQIAPFWQDRNKRGQLVTPYCQDT